MMISPPPFLLMIPRVPASGSTWFCVHGETVHLVPGTGGRTEDDRHAGTSRRPPPSRAPRRQVDGDHDDCIDALGDHPLIAAISPCRGRRQARRDVGHQLARDEPLGLCERELLLQLREDVVLVRIGDADRDVADLPRRLRLDLRLRPGSRRWLGDSQCRCPGAASTCS